MISIRALFVGLILTTLQASGSCSRDYNVDGLPLELCSTDPLTGFTRNGYCDTNEHDQGTLVNNIKSIKFN